MSASPITLGREVQADIPESLRLDPWGQPWIYKTTAPEGFAKLDDQRYELGPARYPQLSALATAIKAEPTAPARGRLPCAKSQAVVRWKSEQRPVRSRSCSLVRKSKGLPWPTSPMAGRFLRTRTVYLCKPFSGMTEWCILSPLPILADSIDGPLDFVIAVMAALLLLELISFWPACRGHWSALILAIPPAIVGGWMVNSLLHEPGSGVDFFLIASASPIYLAVISIITWWLCWRSRRRKS